MEINWNEENIKIKKYLENLPDPNHKNIPKGIIISAGSSHFLSAMIILKQLKFINNTLPIEYYYCGDELLSYQIDFIKINFPEVQLFDCLQVIPSWFPWKIEIKNIKGFMIKSFCMIVSSIQDIFFIDSDNIPFQDINLLFNNLSFIQYHNIFWPDVEFGTDEGKNMILPHGNIIYDYLEIDYPEKHNILPTESGQILIDSVFCWKAVCLSYYLNYYFPIYYSFFYGDKDLYYIAFQKSNLFFFQTSFKPYICYHKNHNQGLLASIFQRDPYSGKPILLHHTKSKITLQNKNYLHFIYPNHYPLLNEKNNLINLYYNYKNHLNTTFVISLYKNLNMNQLKNLIFLLNLRFSHTIIFVFQEKIKKIIDKMINTGKLFSKIEIYVVSPKDIPSFQSKINIFEEKTQQSMIEDIIHEHIYFDLFQYIENNHIKTLPYLIYYHLSKKNEDILHDSYFQLSDSSIQHLNSKCGLFEDFYHNLLILPSHLIHSYHSLYHTYFIHLSKESLLLNPQIIFKEFVDSHSSLFTILKNQYITLPSELNSLHNHNLKYEIDIPPYVFTFYHHVYEPMLKELDKLYKNSDFSQSMKDSFIKDIIHSKKFLYQSTLIDFNEYKKLIDQMNIYLDPHDPLFVHSQLEFELNKDTPNMYILDILIQIILKKNYHNQYTDVRDTIFKYIIKIYTKDKIAEYLQYFDDISYFSLVVRLQCFSIINIKECILLLNQRIHHPFIADMIPIFENLKNKDILIEKLNIVIDSLQQNLYGTLIFIRPFYFNQFYFLTYQNQNNCILRKKISELHRLLFPSINYHADFTKYKEQEPVPPDQIQINKNRIKVGFISQFFKSHSVGRDRIGIIRGLNPDLFDIHVFHFDKIEGDFYRLLCLQSNIHNHFMLFPTLKEYHNHIEKQKLDILVYADIGMIEETYLLAHSRLAPIQINTIGHSETSGINTVDYYISSILYDDLEESQSHYSEKLILTNSLNTFYYRDFYDIYQNSNIQKDYVLPLSPDKIYLSYLQNSLKADVEDLQLLYQILEKIPTIHLVLINLIENSLEDDKLKTYLKPFFDQNRVILLPKLSTNHFYTLIQKSYLILDAYPHGGCNTSLETFHFGKIMISRPSPYLRGRFTKGFYQKMGITDCIVNTPDEYIEKVQYFVNHPDKKLEVEEKIQKQSHLLFHDYQSVVDWNNIFLQLHQK